VILAGISRPLISGFLVLRSSPSDTTTKLAIRRCPHRQWPLRSRARSCRCAHVKPSTSRSKLDVSCTTWKEILRILLFTTTQASLQEELESAVALAKRCSILPVCAREGWTSRSNLDGSCARCQEIERAALTLANLSPISHVCACEGQALRSNLDSSCARCQEIEREVVALAKCSPILRMCTCEGHMSRSNLDIFCVGCPDIEMAAAPRARYLLWFWAPIDFIHGPNRRQNRFPKSQPYFWHSRALPLPDMFGKSLGTHVNRLGSSCA